MRARAQAGAEYTPDSYVARQFPGLVQDIPLQSPGHDLAQDYRRRVMAWAGLPAAAGHDEVICIHATTKSAVFQVRCGDHSRAVKVFDEQQAFRRELLNARLLRGNAVFVQLLDWNESARILEFEWLPSVGLPVHPDEFAGHLARVHSAVRRLPPAAVDIARSVATLPGESSRQPVDVEFMSCTILDLKQGHCGRRVARSGALVQLDLESLTFGADPLLDIAATADMFGLDVNGASWRRFLALYRAELRAQGMQWDLQDLASRSLAKLPL
jgi:hypothetical protein